MEIPRLIIPKAEDMENRSATEKLKQHTRYSFCVKWKIVFGFTLLFPRGDSKKMIFVVITVFKSPLRE